MVLMVLQSVLFSKTQYDIQYSKRTNTCFFNDKYDEIFVISRVKLSRIS